MLGIWYIYRTMILKMRILYIFLVLHTLSCTHVLGGNVKALLSFARFTDPENGPYLESYLNINGASLERIANENGGFHAEILVEISISKLGKEVYQDSYRIISPSVSDSSTIIPDFVDIQRILLKDGLHALTISLKDAADQFALPVTINQEIKMINSQNTNMSDLQIVGSMVKNDQPNMYTKVGYDLYPYTSDYYPESVNDLIFYLEFYPSESDKKKKQEYIVDAYVVDDYTRMVSNNLRRYFKHDAQGVGSVLYNFPLQDLESGNYILVVSAATTLKLEKKKKVKHTMQPISQVNTPILSNWKLTYAVIIPLPAPKRRT